MLTSAQSIVRYDFERRTVVPDRLKRGSHRHYLRAAAAMLSIYQRGSGETRQTLHRKVDHVLDRLGDCPPRRVAAFCKLLDDRSEYNTARGKASALRRRVFTAAASLHPVVAHPLTLLEHSTESARSKVAQDVGKPWSEIEAELFADVIELQTLRQFEADENFSAADLLSAYNVGQTQAALYRATKMTVWARQDLKTIVRHAKLAGLMHRIERLDGLSGQGDQSATPAYRLEFNGPVSPLRQTWRYGVRFARLLPMLLACRGWTLTAEVLGPGPHGQRNRRYRLQLSPRDGLTSPHQRPHDFDSEWEQAIWEAWQRSPPVGWNLQRESELLHHGQTVMTPDFVLRRTDRISEPIYVELLGYWTPEYLREKAIRLEQFRDHRWIVVAPPIGRQAIPSGLIVLPLTGKFRPHELTHLADTAFAPP